MAQLTDLNVFQQRELCVGCGLDLFSWDERTPRTGCRHDRFEPENNRHFLPGAAMLPPISCLRAPGHETPETAAGGALVDIPHAFVVHSPCGFEWGYGGSGPAELALNILALYVPAPEAWRLHQRYKWAVVSRLPLAGGTVTTPSVLAWVRAAWAEDAAKEAEGDRA